MILYIRCSSGATVEWSPPDTPFGKQSVESVCGPIDSYPVEVSDEQAAEIREEYESLSGGSA